MMSKPLDTSATKACDGRVLVATKKPQCELTVESAKLPSSGKDIR